MGRANITITVDEGTAAEIDRLVRAGLYRSRGEAIEAAVQDRFKGLRHSRLVKECAKLDKAEERAFADEGYASE